MRNIILFLFFTILLIGCSDNLVNNPIDETDKVSAPQRIAFEVTQYYTCNDTICPPEKSLIRINTIVQPQSVNMVNILTGDSIITFEEIKFHSESFVLWNTLTRIGYVTINGITYNLNGFGYTYVNLNCNKSYHIEYGIK